MYVCIFFFLFHAGEDMQENIGTKKRWAEGSIDGEKVYVRKLKEKETTYATLKKSSQILSSSMLPCT